MDVDVVVELTSQFGHDLSTLSESQTGQFHKSYGNAVYSLRDFRCTVLDILRQYYGNQNVMEGNKSLKVSARSGTLPADVIVCQSFRKYIRFESLSSQDCVEGIVFETLRDHRRIVNYPKCHYENGVEKNSDARTGGRFKPMIRIFKNARNFMEEKGTISGDLAPSYFIECLLYNAPDACFSGDYNTTLYSLLKWFHCNYFEGSVCQNGQTDLFGPEPEQWNQVAATKFASTMTDLWNKW